MTALQPTTEILCRNLEASGSTLYTAIVKGRRSIADLDLRCANCNWIYEYERGRING